VIRERQPVIALVPEFSRQFGVVVSQSVTGGKETLSIARLSLGGVGCGFDVFF
jgi:hypothetical protein